LETRMEYFTSNNSHLVSEPTRATSLSYLSPKVNVCTPQVV
jgi:hypothetical protein